jgi:tetratricopeptide (TPR) repeat protein
VGRALQERGDCAGALDAYDRALGVYPRYADAHYNRGAALICLDRQAEALQAYRQAAASRPGFAKALFAVAVLVEHLEGPAAAEAAYRQLLAVDPGHPEGSRALAAILAAQGRADEADGVAARARDQPSEAPNRGRGPAGRAAPTPP